MRIAGAIGRYRKAAAPIVVTPTPTPGAGLPLPAYIVPSPDVFPSSANSGSVLDTGWRTYSGASFAEVVQNGNITGWYFNRMPDTAGGINCFFAQIYNNTNAQLFRFVDGMKSAAIGDFKVYTQNLTGPQDDIEFEHREKGVVWSQGGADQGNLSYAYLKTLWTGDSVTNPFVISRSSVRAIRIGAAFVSAKTGLIDPHLHIDTTAPSTAGAYRYDFAFRYSGSPDYIMGKVLTADGQDTILIDSVLVPVTAVISAGSAVCTSPAALALSNLPAVRQGKYCKVRLFVHNNPSYFWDTLVFYPKAASFGPNLGGQAGNWGPRANLFENYMYVYQGPYAGNNAAPPITPTLFTSDGHLASGDVVANLRYPANPDNTFDITFDTYDGTPQYFAQNGPITFSGLTKISDRHFRGKLTYDKEAPPGGLLVGFTFPGASQSNPVRNLKAIEAGQVDPEWSDAWINGLGSLYTKPDGGRVPMRTLLTVSPQDAASNPNGTALAKSWAGITPECITANDFFAYRNGSDYVQGWPPGWQLRGPIRRGHHPHLPVPGWRDRGPNGWYQSLARLVVAELAKPTTPADLLVYIELMDENWNPQFLCYHYCGDYWNNGPPFGNGTPFDGYNAPLAMYGYGKHHVEVMDDFLQGYLAAGGDRSRIQFVANFASENPARYAWWKSIVQDQYNRMDLVDIVMGNGYHTPDFSGLSPYTDFNAMQLRDQQALAGTIDLAANFADVVRADGKEYGLYEFNLDPKQVLVVNSGMTEAQLAAYQRSPQRADAWEYSLRYIKGKLGGIALVWAEDFMLNNFGIYLGATATNLLPPRISLVQQS